MKILMLAPTPFFSDRGCHVRIYEETMALQQQGHQVEVLTYPLGNEVSGVKTSRIAPLLFWYKKTTAGPSWWKLILDLQLLWLTRHKLRQQNYDVLHAHLHEGMFIAYWARVLSGSSLPIVFDYQGSLTAELDHHQFMATSSFLGKLFVCVESWINQRADILFTSATSLVDTIIDRDKLKRKPEVVADAVGEVPKTTQKKQRELCQKLNLSLEYPVVVYLGLLNRYQGVDLLLEAFQLVIEVMPKTHLLVLGYPAKKYQLQAAVLGLKNNVTFTGRVSYFEIYDYLALGDLAVAPKLVETEANGKLYNYLAAGLPTVAFDTQLNRVILGNAGLFVKKKSVKALAQALRQLIQNSESRDQLRQASKKRSSQTSSWQKSIHKLEAIYQKVVSSS